MRRYFYIFLAMLLITGCSLKKNIPNVKTVEVSDEGLQKAIRTSMIQLLDKSWLPDFVAQKGARPILMTGKISHTDRIIANTDLCYNMIDLILASSGRVRVVRTNAGQRAQDPKTLVKGKSVDYVISAEVKTAERGNSAFLYLYLWGEEEMPVQVVSTLIE